MVEIFAIAFSLLLEICAKAPAIFIFESPLSMVTTESENHIGEMELCLKMRPWAESFGNLHADARIKSPGRRVSDEGCGVCASIYQRAVHVSAV